MNSKAPQALQKDTKVTVAHKNHAEMIIGGRVSSTATTIYQIPLFFAQMVGTLGFDVVRVLERAVAVCRANGRQPIAEKKVGACDGDDSEAASIERASLFAVAT